MSDLAPAYAMAGADAACAICYCLWCWLDPLLGGGSAAFAMAAGFFGWLSGRFGGPNAPGEYGSGWVGPGYLPSLGSAFGKMGGAFEPRPPYVDRWGRWTTGPGRLIYFSDGLQDFVGHFTGEDVVGTVPSSGKA